MSTPAGSDALRAGNSRTNVFGILSPCARLRLPENLIITSVEFFVFFPNSSRNYDLLLCFVPAGIHQLTIANMVNCHRSWEKWPAHYNTIGKLIMKEFRENFIKGWTITMHEEKELTYGYQPDDDDLTLNGMRLNCEVNPKFSKKGKVTNRSISMPFADLATDVDVFPSHTAGDGIMLTRCVQYAVAHPEKGYMFPDDCAYLFQKLYDGRQVTAAHLDKASILRWETKGFWGDDEEPQVETFANVVEDSDDEALEVGEAGESNNPEDEYHEAAKYHGNEDSHDDEECQAEPSVGAAPELYSQNDNVDSDDIYSEDVQNKRRILYSQSLGPAITSTQALLDIPLTDDPIMSDHHPGYHLAYQSTAPFITPFQAPLAHDLSDAAEQASFEPPNCEGSDQDTAMPYQWVESEWSYPSGHPVVATASSMATLDSSSPVLPSSATWWFPPQTRGYSYETCDPTLFAGFEFPTT